MRQWIMLAVAGFAFGCDSSDGRHEMLQMAASLPPHAWMIERLGAPDVRATALLGPGDSPATYQPSDADVTRVLASDAFFRAGVPFESGAWFEALSEQLPPIDLRRGVSMRAITGPVIGTISGHSNHDHTGDALDPHIWLSPRRLQVQARTITTELQKLDPGRAEDYARGLESLLHDLRALDERIASLLAPFGGRPFVIFHPSWGYFADDYGLRQIAIEVGGQPPSDAEVTRLAEEMRALGVTVVFVQPQIAGMSARAVARAANARIETLDPLRPDVLENLWSSAEKIARSFDEK